MSSRSVRVYLAAVFRRREEMRVVADLLRSLGFTITSRWLEVETDQLHAIEGPAWACNDVENVEAADVLVFFSEEAGSLGAGRGGRHVEFGVALAAGKEIIVVGPVENIFHRHPRVAVVRSVTEAVQRLKVFTQEAV